MYLDISNELFCLVIFVLVLCCYWRRRAVKAEGKLRDKSNVQPTDS